MIEMAAPAGEVQIQVSKERLAGMARVAAGPGARTAVSVRLGPAEP